MEDSKASKYLNFRRWFFTIWFLIMIIGGTLLIVTYGSRWRFDYNARMTEFSICSGLASTGTPIPVTRPITIEAKEIKVCGYLEGNGPTIPLTFYWLYNGEGVVRPLTGYYEVGYVMARFVAPSSGLKAGRYVVLVHRARNKLASTEFTIEEP